VKAEVWAKLTDLDSKESIYQRSARMSGFYNYKQLDLIKPYFDKFYEFLPQLLGSKQTFKYVEAFFDTLLPRMVITDSNIVFLLSLKL
jgi:hypothetical protein